MTGGRSTRRIPVEERLVANTLKTDGCWLWTGPLNNRGYGRLRIRDGRGGHRVQYAHRAAFELANGPLLAGQVVRHLCDNPRCVRPEHLLAGTHRDNMRDMSERDRHPRFHPKAIRDEAIRRVTNGASMASVARAMGLPYGTVTALVWKSRHGR